MKKRNKNLLKKFLIIIVLIFGIICFRNLYMSAYKVVSDNFSKSEYKIIKQDKNENYSGFGQKKLKNQDGFSTTFTTIEENKKTYIEYKQNGNSSWSKNKYWGGTMEKNGCAITVMSIILSGYGKKETPEDLRQKYYPVLDYNKLSSELLNSFGIENSDFLFDSAHLSKENLISHLKTNRPIIICVWNKPQNNRWTTSSHYMALLACDDSEKVYVSNPNGGENDYKSSGWYDIDEVSPYIAKAIFIESYN